MPSSRRHLCNSAPAAAPLLLPQLPDIPSLEDKSAETGLPYPHLLTSERGEQAARTLQAGYDLLRRVLPPSWRLMTARQEFGRRRAVLVTLPEGTELPALTLPKGGRHLSA